MPCDDDCRGFKPFKAVSTQNMSPFNSITSSSEESEIKKEIANIRQITDIIEVPLEHSRTSSIKKPEKENLHVSNISMSKDNEAEKKKKSRLSRKSKNKDNKRTDKDVGTDQPKKSVSNITASSDNNGCFPRTSKNKQNKEQNTNKSDKITEILAPVPSSGPPPPPEGGEELWDLQFCKWWGWNWVKRRDKGGQSSQNGPFPQNYPTRFSYPGYGPPFDRYPPMGNYQNGFAPNQMYPDPNCGVCKKNGGYVNRATKCKCRSFCKRLFSGLKKACACKNNNTVCLPCAAYYNYPPNEKRQLKFAHSCYCCSPNIVCKPRNKIMKNRCNPRAQRRCECCCDCAPHNERMSDTSLYNNHSTSSFHDDLEYVSVKLYGKNMRPKRYVCYPSDYNPDKRKAVPSGSNNKENYYSDHNIRNSKIMQGNDRIAASYFLQNLIPNLSKLDLEKKLSKFGKPYTTFSWLDKQLRADYCTEEFKSPISGKTYNLNVPKVTSSNFIRNSILPEPIDPRNDNIFQFNTTQLKQYIKNETHVSPPFSPNQYLVNDNKNDLQNADLLQDVKFNLSKIETLMNKLLNEKPYEAQDNKSCISSCSKNSAGSSTLFEKEINVENASVSTDQCVSQSSSKAFKRSLSDISIEVNPKKIKVLNRYHQKSVNEVFEKINSYFEDDAEIDQHRRPMNGFVIDPCEFLKFSQMKSKTDGKNMTVIEEEEMFEARNIAFDDYDQGKGATSFRKHSIHSATTCDKNNFSDDSPHTNTSYDISRIDNIYKSKGGNPLKRKPSMIPIRKRN